jgi:flagellin-like protein
MLRKNRKALSPVIASIILIAVTVAVSVVVASWMGGISVGFMGNVEQATITNIEFVTSPANSVNITIVNSGASNVNLQSATIDGNSVSMTATGPTNSLTVAKGTSANVIITNSDSFASGTQYAIKITTAKGNTIFLTDEANPAPAQSNINCVPITITNSQSSVTPSTFQEKITWNPSVYASYESSDLGNIRFYSDSNLATPLYAWLESCTPSLNKTATSATAWVKLTSSIAGNGGTDTIYMAFLSDSKDFDGLYWGTAPNLSTTYGQFDNGAKVFSFYDNFAGTTISNVWNTAGAAGTYSVNNGLTVNSGAFPGYTFTLNNQFTGPLIIDAYQVGTAGNWLGVSFSNLQTTDASYSLTSGAIQWLYPPQGPWGSCDGLYIASGGTAVTPNPPSTTLQVVTLAVNSTTAIQYQNYANPVTASGTISLTNYPGLDQLAYNTPSDTQTTYWFRLRAYPPNEVMPTVSFGSVIS